MAVYSDFNEKYRNRTKKFAVEIVKFYSKNCKKVDELRIIGKQLLRSGTSVAANFRAFTRGRSEAEKYSKLCIVVEEADETQFWLELLLETQLIEPEMVRALSLEIEELVKVFTVVKSKMKR
jgi:four helix bundle protein